jgi:hypothetical protein
MRAISKIHLLYKIADEETGISLCSVEKMKQGENDTRESNCSFRIPGEKVNDFSATLIRKTLHDFYKVEK